MSELFSADNFITDAVKNYSDTIYRVALNITKDREDALDVCQDVFVRLVKSKDKIKDDEHLKAWLLRATVNCAKSCCNQAYRKHQIAIDSLRESDIAQNDKYNTLIESVMELPEKYSTVIHLFYYEDMKIKEIAQTLKLSQSAVKQRLVRGREKLKIILEKGDYYD